jgi:hypothetical protein
LTSTLTSTLAHSTQASPVRRTSVHVIRTSVVTHSPVCKQAHRPLWAAKPRPEQASNRQSTTVVSRKNPTFPVSPTPSVVGVFVVLTSGVAFRNTTEGPPPAPLRPSPFQFQVQRNGNQLDGLSTNLTKSDENGRNGKLPP